MAVDLYEGCWTRWDRANEHRRRMSEVWNDYLDEQPFDFSLDDQGGGEFILRVHQSPPAPSLFAVLCGEWLYNLRGCLDYIIWATAGHVSGVVPPPNENKLQYPIYSTEREWRRSLHRLEPLAEHHREMLLIMQPFNSNSDANYLGWVNDLARVDRHRQLSSITAYIAVAEPVVSIPDATNRHSTLQWGQRVLINGQADLARLVVSPWDDTLRASDVRVNPRLGIDPEIAAWARSDFWRGIRFTDRLAMIQTFVAGEIATYEYDCTGQSRKANALTDNYKQQCDSRRDGLPPLRLPTVEVEWGEARHGRASTRARFEGHDFPTRPER